MSAFDSGLIMLEAPVRMGIKAVSLAAAQIRAEAENYRRFRFDEAYAQEMARKAEFDFIAGLSDDNRLEYEALLEERITQEQSRQEAEGSAQDQAAVMIRDELREKARTEAQIRMQIERMDDALAAYEAEFGTAPELRDMAETIRHSREMFGDGKQVLQELNDLLFVILPGKTQENRDREKEKQLEARYSAITAQHHEVVDSSREFISLHTQGIQKTAAGKTPWESFVKRVQAVAEVEQMYFETQASAMLEEMQGLPEGRRNFYIQQHESDLQEMEERAGEYRSQQQALSEKTMEEFCLYLSMAENLGVEPRFGQDDLYDAYVLQEMRDETRELVEAYKRQKERQYTLNAFNVVMKRHNLQFETMAADGYGLEHVEYSMDEQTGVRITRAQSGAFEMQFQAQKKGAALSMDEERRITEKAKHFCSLLPSITKELEEEFGISFAQTSLQPPRIENIEITQSRRSARQERARVQKAMQMK